MILCVNGSIWWCGEKSAVGKVDPNEVRKNKYDPKDEEQSYQYTFLPYFPPGEYHEHSMVKFKSIASHFTAKVNFAISEHNEVYVFGDCYPFQMDAQKRRDYVFAAVGKGFQTLITGERLPYTWGDNKNGKLGLQYEPEKDTNQWLEEYVRREPRDARAEDEFKDADP